MLTPKLKYPARSFDPLSRGWIQGWSWNPCLGQWNPGTRGGKPLSQQLLIAANGETAMGTRPSSPSQELRMVGQAWVHTCGGSGSLVPCAEAAAWFPAPVPRERWWQQFCHQEAQVYALLWGEVVGGKQALVWGLAEGCILPGQLLRGWCGKCPATASHGHVHRGHSEGWGVEAGVRRLAVISWVQGEGLALVLVVQDWVVQHLPVARQGRIRPPMPGRHLRPIQVGGVSGLLPDVGGLGPAGCGCVGSRCAPALAMSPGRWADPQGRTVAAGARRGPSPHCSVPGLEQPGGLNLGCRLLPSNALLGKKFFNALRKLKTYTQTGRVQEECQMSSNRSVTRWYRTSSQIERSAKMATY